MSYVKVPKACSDAPVGFRAVNAIADNLALFKTNFEVYHAPGVAQSQSAGGPGLPPLNTTFSQNPGQHDAPLIARGTIFVQVAVSPPVAGQPQITNYISFVAGAITTMRRLATGTFFLPMVGFSKVWGRATHQQALDSGGGPGFCRTVVSSPGDPSGPGLTVYSYFVTSSGSTHDRLQLFDSGFYLVAFGRK